jgi:Sulfatase
MDGTRGHSSRLSGVFTEYHCLRLKGLGTMINRLFQFVRRFAGPRAVAFGVALLTLLVEFSLVERKYALFSGGFGQSKAVDTPGEYALVLIGAVGAHGLLFWFLWRGLSRLHARRARGLVLRFNLIFVGGALFSALLAMKFELLSYFSDAVDLKLIRSLGGGSLMEALVYGLHEGGLAVPGAVAGILLYCGGLWWMMRRDPKGPKQNRVPIKRLPIFAALCAVPVVFLLINNNAEGRYANSQFLAYGTINNGLQLATDFDQDGYSWFSSQIDDAPFDGSRHPFALDIPNNGIDEDGLGGDLKLTGLPPVAQTPNLGGARLNVIHVVFESARGDLVGKRINGRLVAPNLTALAAAGSFQPIYSPLGFTAGSLKAIFTGRIEPPIGGTSLFSDFKANGYGIGVFSGQAEDFGDISETVGSRRNSDVFIDAMKLKDERAYGYASLASLKLDEMIVLREFKKAYGSRDAWKKPNYIYFNFQSGHFPYHHPGMKDIIDAKPLPRDAIKLANKDGVALTYWNAQAYSDLALGELIGHLKAMGVWENTLLLVSGDHGEALFEDGFLGHGHILNHTQYQTGMVVNRPGLGGRPLMGLVDYRAFIEAIVMGKAPPVRTEPLLLHIGPLDTPGGVAMVETNGAMTILRLDTMEVQLGEAAVPVPVASLSTDGKRRLGMLEHLWGVERWRRHLSDAEIKR